MEAKQKPNDVDGDETAVTSAKPEKKTRNVSCAPCRMRRVKCEKLPGATECVKCVIKGIRCVAPPKKDKTAGALVNQSGKRIKSVKELFAAPLSVPPQQQDVSTPTDKRIYHVEIQGSVMLSLLEAGLEERFRYLIGEDLIAQFHRHGKQVERLPESSQVYCSLIVANGARISNHPVCIGNMPGQSTTAQDFPSGGYRREAFCRKMASYAVKFADMHGVLRIPNIFNVIFLFMLDKLNAGDNSYTPYTWAFITQIRELMAREDAFGLETPGTDDVVQMGTMKGSPMAWVAYNQDSMRSFLGGTAPLLDEEDVERIKNGKQMTLLMALSPWGREQIKTSSWLFLHAISDHISNTLRDTAVGLNGPRARKAPRIDEKMAIRFIDDFELVFIGFKKATALFKEQLEAGEDHLQADLAALRGTPYVPLLKFMGLIEERQKQSKARLDSFALLSFEHLQDELAYQERLDAMQQRAVNLVLSSIREVIQTLGALTVAKNVLPAYYLVVGGPEHLIETLPKWLKVFLQTPPTELGGPVDFSFKTKMHELQMAHIGVKQMSWSHACPNEYIQWFEEEIKTLDKEYRAYHQAMLESAAAIPAPYAITDQNLYFNQYGY